MKQKNIRDMLTSHAEKNTTLAQKDLAISQCNKKLAELFSENPEASKVFSDLADHNAARCEAHSAIASASIGCAKAVSAGDFGKASGFEADEIASPKVSGIAPPALRSVPRAGAPGTATADVPSQFQKLFSATEDLQ